MPRNWIDQQNQMLEGRPPRELIEAGEGHRAEALIELIEHTHNGFLELHNLQARFGDVQELRAVRETFEFAKLQWPWRP